MAEYERDNKTILVQINAYNNDVREFKAKYNAAMYCLNSKWINWYEYGAIKNIDASSVKYITVEDLI